MIPKILRGFEIMLVDAHAAAAYAPPRQTKDVDCLIAHEHYAEAEGLLRDDGWTKTSDLAFFGSRLGLYGGAWHKLSTDDDIDVLASPQAWAAEAFLATSSFDRSGTRVLGLPYLVLMKIDSARGIDQADLTRMLGRLDGDAVEEIVRTIERQYDDSQAAEDVRQYAALGRWEYESEER